MPVPLRRTFTYRVPPALARRARRRAVASRCRSAPRKLAGFVLGPAARAAARHAASRTSPGVLDPLPLFTDELLRFLREAADYYLHPLGEVLRAAAPALPSRSDDRAAQGRLPRRRARRCRARASPRAAVLVVRLCAGMPAADARLGKSQRVLVQLLSERGEVTLDELRRHVGNPRARAARARRQGPRARPTTREVRGRPLLRRAQVAAGAGARAQPRAGRGDRRDHRSGSAQRRRRSCCTASPARARPRCTCA